MQLRSLVWSRVRKLTLPNLKCFSLPMLAESKGLIFASSLALTQLPSWVPTLVFLLGMPEHWTRTWISFLTVLTRNLLARKPTYCHLLAVKCSSKQLLLLFRPMWCKQIFFLAEYWIIWIDSTGTFYGDLVNQREECIGLVGKKLPNLWIRVALASKLPKGEIWPIFQSWIGGSTQKKTRFRPEF